MSRRDLEGRKYQVSGRRGGYENPMPSTLARKKKNLGRRKTTEKIIHPREKKSAAGKGRKPDLTKRNIYTPTEKESRPRAQRE